MGNLSKQNQDDSHAFADTTERFALDFLIRKSGFKIHQRNGGEAIWTRNGVPFAQSDLIRRFLNWSEVRDALFLEETYFDQVFE